MASPIMHRFIGFLLFIRGPDVLSNALKFRSSVARWRHKIRKFAAEIFKNAKNRTQSCAKYFVWLLFR